MGLCTYQNINSPKSWNIRLRQRPLPYLCSKT